MRGNEELSSGRKKKRFTDLFSLQHSSGSLDVWVKSYWLRYHQLFLCLLCRSDHLLGIRESRSYRFLHQNMLPSLQRLDRIWSMQVMWQDDVDYLDVGPLQDL